MAKIEPASILVGMAVAITGLLAYDYFVWQGGGLVGLLSGETPRW